MLDADDGVSGGYSSIEIPHARTLNCSVHSKKCTHTPQLASHYFFISIFTNNLICFHSLLTGSCRDRAHPMLFLLCWLASTDLHFAGQRIQMLSRYYECLLFAQHSICKLNRALDPCFSLFIPTPPPTVYGGRSL